MGGDGVEVCKYLCSKGSVRMTCSTLTQQNITQQINVRKPIHESFVQDNRMCGGAQDATGWKVQLAPLNCFGVECRQVLKLTVDFNLARALERATERD